MKLVWLGVALACAVSSCRSAPGLFEWGPYEDSVYALCATPEEFDIGAEIQRISELVERAAIDDRNVAPGVHAHLGYLYSLNGDYDAAAAALRAEADVYPESKVFVDGLMARLAASSASGGNQ